MADYSCMPNGIKMCHYCLLVCFLWIATASGQTDCSQKPDGVYGIGCKSFEVCKSGELIIIDCTPLVFNNQTQKCDEPANVLPPCGQYRDCSDVPDGTYTDFDYNCTSYYSCVHHQFYGHNFCTPGTVFEQTLGTCVWPTDAYEPCGTKPLPPL